MKRLLQTFLIFTALLMYCGESYSQGLYVNVNTGYNFCMSTHNLYNDDLDIYFYNVTATQNSQTYERINLSLGKGVNFGGAIGYMFSEYIGAELGISYLLGTKTKAKYTYPGSTADLATYSRMLRFIPAIIISPAFDEINPYVRIGLILGTGSVHYEYDANVNGDVVVQKMKANGGLAFGLNTAIGAQFGLSDNMALFAEVVMVNMSSAPTKGEITEYTINGVDMLPNLTTRDKEAEFVNEVTYSETSHPDSEPDKLLKYSVPYGSIGVNVGIIIFLGK